MPFEVIVVNRLHTVYITVLPNPKIEKKADFIVETAVLNILLGAVEFG